MKNKLFVVLVLISYFISSCGNTGENVAPEKPVEEVKKEVTVDLIEIDAGGNPINNKAEKITLPGFKGENGPRSAAATSKKVVYIIEEGDSSKDKSSYLYKIEIDNQGNIKKTKSEFHFSKISPVDIVIYEANGKTYAIITAESKDGEKCGVYVIDLEKAFQKNIKQKDCSKFFVTTGEFGKKHLTGISIDKKTSTIYIVGYDDGDDSKIFKVIPKPDKDITKFDLEVSDMVTKNSIIKGANDWKEVFGIVVDPDNPKIIYVVTHPAKKNNQGKGKVLKATIDSKGKATLETIASNIIGATSLKIITRTNKQGKV